MEMPSSAKVLDPEDYAQNDRLLDLEGAVRDISVKTGQIEIRQEHLLSKVEEGFDSLKEEFKSVSEKQIALEARITPIEVESISAGKRWENIKKVLIPIGAAVAGVIGTKLGGVLLDLLGK